MKYLLIVLLISLSIILTACEGFDFSKVSDTDLQRISTAAVVCDEPYMRFGTGCCLDRNNNRICDNDESTNIPPEKEEEPLPTPVPEPEVDIVKLSDDDSFLGEKDAPVTIVEFGDFECPFCARFNTDTFPQLEEEYIKTGKVKFVYRDFPLSFHANAQKAAEASECAGEQGKYWQMHNLMFAKGVSAGVSSFKQFAEDLKLDMKTFNICLDSGQMINEIKDDLTDGQRAGVQGTPAFFINGKLISGAQPFNVFQQIIEDQLN